MNPYAYNQKWITAILGIGLVLVVMVVAMRFLRPKPAGKQTIPGPTTNPDGTPQPQVTLPPVSTPPYVPPVSTPPSGNAGGWNNQAFSDYHKRMASMADLVIKGKLGDRCELTNNLLEMGEYDFQKTAELYGIWYGKSLTDGYCALNCDSGCFWACLDGKKDSACNRLKKL